MFNLLFLLTLGSCMTTNKQIEKARGVMGGVDCLVRLEKKLRKSHCSQLEVKRGMHQMVLRCKKVDRDRKNIWDTWWFRLSSSILEIHPDLIEEIEKHTICIDAQVRIEAYPPEKVK